jgi:hypothetical protein
LATPSNISKTGRVSKKASLGDVSMAQTTTFHGNQRSNRREGAAVLIVRLG